MQILGTREQSANELLYVHEKSVRFVFSALDAFQFQQRLEVKSQRLFLLEFGVHEIPHSQHCRQQVTDFGALPNRPTTQNYAR